MHKFPNYRQLIADEVRRLNRGAPVGSTPLRATGGGAGQAAATSPVAATLDGLQDVTLSAPEDGDGLVYDAVNGVWVNGASGGVPKTAAYLLGAAAEELPNARVLQGTTAQIVLHEDEEAGTLTLSLADQVQTKRLRLLQDADSPIIQVQLVADQTADILRALASDGTTVLVKIDKDGVLQAAGYKAGDGTAGASATTGGATFKNGLYTGGTITPGGSLDINGLTLLTDPLADDDYLPAFDTSANANRKVAGAYLDRLAPNLLINGGFSFWQRQIPGTLTALPNGGYCADRWYSVVNTGTSIKARRWKIGDISIPAVPPDGAQAFAQVKNDSGDTDYSFALIQPIESQFAVNLRGQYATLQFAACAGTGATPTLKYRVYEWTGAADSASAKQVISSWVYTDAVFASTSLNAVCDGSVELSDNGWTAVEVVTDVISSSMTNIVVIFWVEALGTGESIYLANADLHRGIIRRRWQGDRLNEFALCLRYFESSYRDGDPPGKDIASAYGMTGITFSHPTASFGQSFVYNTRKRTAPTVTIYSCWGTKNKVCYFNGSWNDNGGMAVYVNEQAFFYIQSNITGTIQTGFMYTSEAEL